MYGPSLRGSIFSPVICCWAVFSSNTLVPTSSCFCKCFLSYVSCCFCALVMFAWAFLNAWLLDSNSAPMVSSRLLSSHHPLWQDIGINWQPHLLLKQVWWLLCGCLLWCPVSHASGLCRAYHPSRAYLHQQSQPDTMIRFGLNLSVSLSIVKWDTSNQWIGFWTGLLNQYLNWICSYHLTSSQSEEWTGHMFVSATTMASYTISAVANHHSCPT